MDLIERNLKIIKSLDKSSLYKHLYDNKIKLILYFLLIIIVSFSILYYIYQKYFINPMNYSSYLNLENIKTVSYKKPIKCAVLLTGNVYDISTLITQKYFIYNELNPDIYCYFNDNKKEAIDSCTFTCLSLSTFFSGVERMGLHYNIPAS